MTSPVAASSSQERVLHIPELMEAVGSHLVGRDLLACIRVCNFWNEFFIPILWNTIDDSLYAWPRILRESDNCRYPLNENWLKSIFAKYGKHIRHLIIHWRVLIDIAYLDRACTNLLSIQIMDIKQYHTYNEKVTVSKIKYRTPGGSNLRRFPNQRHFRGVAGVVLIPELEGVFSPTAILLKSEERQKRDWMTQQYFWMLLRQNQGLRSISLHHDLNLLSEITSLTFVYDTLAMLPSLTSLENCLYVLDYTVLLRRVPSLRNYTSLPIVRMPATGPVGPFWNLNSLKIAASVALGTIDRMLRSLPGLTTLHLWSLHNIISQTAPSSSPAQRSFTEEVITDIRPFSTTFHLKTLILETQPDNVFRNQDETNTVFACFPDLAVIHCTNLSPEVGQAASQFCPRLEQVCQLTDGDSICGQYYLRNIFTSYTVSPNINSQGPLFRSCRSLRVFDAIQHAFDAEYISIVTWVCVGLEVFRCQIVGLKRLNECGHSVLSYITESGLAGEECSNEERRVLEEVRACKYLHEAVYDQLSRLTKLRVLDLGYEYRRSTHYRKRYTVGGNEYRVYGLVIRDTLQLSLTSGLDRLSTLKNLQVFGFEGVDHEMDLPELEWIAEHWPNLRVMRGLQKDDRHAYLKPDKMQRLLRKAMQSLRPDIRHESGKKYN
ncbi:hypothetical protein BGZ91_005630 [Linnemannia elongata]|nr:hypothetical protein BGZ91_005630 [Linnemannia elongata]